MQKSIPGEGKASHKLWGRSVCPTTGRGRMPGSVRRGVPEGQGPRAQPE